MNNDYPLKWRFIMSKADTAKLMEQAITNVVGDSEEFTGAAMFVICQEFGRLLGVPADMLDEYAFTLWDDVCTTLEAGGWPGGAK